MARCPKPKVGPKRREWLIRDILSAQYDLVELSKRYELKPHDLAKWATAPSNHTVLSGLCFLADLQTQLLLSRYRLLAASRLIKLATDEEAQANPDIARRACVDLLRLDLKRADLDAVLTADPDIPESDVPLDLTDLRQMIYGSLQNAREDSNRP